MKTQQQVPYSIRQGDVLLVAADYRGWKDGQDVTPKDRIVLAHGEVTGHAHAIAKPKKVARYFDAAAERFLQALAGATLRHEEHSAILLSPEDGARGRYQQAFQVEEQGEEVRRVAD